VQISHHVHKPDICTPIEGKVYSLTGNTPGWPKLPRHTPFHVGCRHVETPFVDTFLSDEKIAELQALSNQAEPVYTYTPEQLARADAKRAQRERGRKMRKEREAKNAAAVASGKKKPVQAVREEVAAGRTDDEPQAVSPNLAAGAKVSTPMKEAGGTAIWKKIASDRQGGPPEAVPMAMASGDRKRDRETIRGMAEGASSGRRPKRSSRGGPPKQRAEHVTPPGGWPVVELADSPEDGKSILRGLIDSVTLTVDGQRFVLDAGDTEHPFDKEDPEENDRYRRATWILPTLQDGFKPIEGEHHGKPRVYYLSRMREDSSGRPLYFVVSTTPLKNGEVKLTTWYVVTTEDALDDILHPGRHK